MMKRFTSRAPTVMMLAALAVLMSVAGASAQSRRHWQDQAYSRGFDGSFYNLGGHYSNWPQWGVSRYPQWGSGSYEMPGGTISGLNGI